MRILSFLTLLSFFLTPLSAIGESAWGAAPLQVLPNAPYILNVESCPVSFTTPGAQGLYRVAATNNGQTWSKIIEVVKQGTQNELADPAELAAALAPLVERFPIEWLNGMVKALTTAIGDRTVPLEAAMGKLLDWMVTHPKLRNPQVQSNNLVSYASIEKENLQATFDQYEKKIREQLLTLTFDKRHTYREVKLLIQQELLAMIEQEWKELTLPLMVPPRHLLLEEAVVLMRQRSEQQWRGRERGVTVPIQKLRILQGLKEQLSHFADYPSAYLVPALDYAVGITNNPEVIIGNLWESYIPSMKEVLAEKGLYELFQRIDALLRTLVAPEGTPALGLLDLAEQLQETILKPLDTHFTQLHAATNTDIGRIIAKQNLAPLPPLPTPDPEDAENLPLILDIPAMLQHLPHASQQKATLKEYALQYLEFHKKGSKAQFVMAMKSEIYLKVREALANLLRAIHFQDPAPETLDELLERASTRFTVDDSLTLLTLAEQAAKTSIFLGKGVKAPELLDATTKVKMKLEQAKKKMIALALVTILGNIKTQYGKLPLAIIVQRTEDTLAQSIRRDPTLQAVLNDIASSVPGAERLLKIAPIPIKGKLAEALKTLPEVAMAHTIARRLDYTAQTVSLDLAAARPGFTAHYRAIKNAQKSTAQVLIGVEEQLRKVLELKKKK